jgi:hypothetical protein
VNELEAYPGREIHKATRRLPGNIRQRVLRALKGLRALLALAPGLAAAEDFSGTYLASLPDRAEILQPAQWSGRMSAGNRGWSSTSSANRLLKPVTWTLFPKPMNGISNGLIPVERWTKTETAPEPSSIEN